MFQVIFHPDSATPEECAAFPVVLGKEGKGNLMRFPTIKAAEAYIEHTLESLDPKGVEEGHYYVDAPCEVMA